MKSNDPVLALYARSIDKAVSEVRRALKEECGLDVPQNRVREGMAEILYRKIDTIAEDLREIFTSPEREEFRQLEKVLGEHSTSLASGPERVEATDLITEATVFSGQRPFSPEKLGAMIEYLLGQGRTVYKTSLNKLLFYADLTAFYLRGSGISGAVYLNRPYGPVADAAADVLEELIEDGRVTIAERTKHFETRAGVPELLDSDELKVLDWVLETYGGMGAREISDHSHDERAYKDTRPNEPIAYAYSKFFRQLPPSDLLS